MDADSIPTGAEPTPSSLSRWLISKCRSLRRWLKWGLALFVVILFGLIEIRTSVVQSWLFTATNKRISFEPGDGRSSSIAFPRPAPFDDRRGYSKLPDFQARLEQLGYRTTQQVRQSETLAALISRGIAPPYTEPPETAMVVHGINEGAGPALFQYAQSEFIFKSISDIPPLLVKTLLFLENRDLDRPAASWQNPVIEWDRMLKAALYYIGAKLYLPVPVQGGSTLAVQLEKFRHSPHGRTDTPLEKVRQVVGASLKAYRAGKNTRGWRERIIVDYFNTVPLAAAPGYGEIHGLGEGLHAWFGTELKDAVTAINASGLTPAKVDAYKQALTLLVSVRSPSAFLVDDRAGLEEKVRQFARLMARDGVIDSELAEAVAQSPIEFLGSGPTTPQPSSYKNKAANAVRITTMEYLGINNVYDLNRLDLSVQSTIDVPLQQKVNSFLNSLWDPAVVQAKGLVGEYLLNQADPKKIVYSFLLVEPTPQGNMIRVQADNLATPFDFNKSVKLELGSTAKLRTLVHYLEIIAELHQEYASLAGTELRQAAQRARDPLTRWVIEAIQEDPKLAVAGILEKSMERRYSANPGEMFFTGGGLHDFANFDPIDDGKILPLREAFNNSVNLVFIRLMRDIISYHRARLSYDTDQVLANPNHPERRRILEEIGEEESRAVLRRSYQTYNGQSEDKIVARLIGRRGNTAKRLTVLFFAWRIGTDEQALTAWLNKHNAPVSPTDVTRLFRAYRNPRLTMLDFAYLISVHPLDLWCASEYRKNPNLSWNDLLNNSRTARVEASSWLLNPRNRRAQDLRLRIRFEREAFARLTPYWQKLGFPFKTMVPSYASSIGSSGDRPVALAELVGILVNDGVRLPATTLTQIHFAAGTPYETVFERRQPKGEAVLPLEVARAARKAMAGVVANGTARRIHGVFKDQDGKPITVGGKTGSGDNRVQTFNRSGGVTSSRATNRTATFVFYIGDRYYGVITAYVQGRDAEHYKFTSALPVSILKLLAPTITEHFNDQLIPALAPTREKQDKVKIRDINFTPSPTAQPRPTPPAKVSGLESRVSS
jgi:membrane peptidoglycan carboxypeptidase